MAIVFNQPQTIAQLLEQKLTIPEYQRPYKWQVKHVNQLVDDIFNHRTKPCYRLGTVVLHQDKKKFYQENNRAESLKQAIMMSYDDWGESEQGKLNIVRHELEMISVLRGN
ncbi:hypothetical protein BCT04_14560 [Vibrio breoganii]|uniref:GmrSD restriction endonuclease domain-containing protein n=1 Tax=Vibrio breoganii TaxID=553239 RepID=UPI000C824A80|nr:DUF262 domain-containing protein [Vibrio breoganii]PMO64130.1 hypothetical protein BCT04_14560 [Vibrio breoganii]